MEGVTINNTDISEYGAILLAGAYAQLLTPPELKEWVSNDDARKNGTEYIAPTTPVVKERNVNLTFGIKGENEEDFLAKYNAFISVLHSGFIKLYVPKLGRYYHLKFESCTSFEQYSLKACKLAVKFTEPDPTNKGA